MENQARKPKRSTLSKNRKDVICLTDVRKKDSRYEHYSHSLKQFCCFINFQIQEKQDIGNALGTITSRAEAVRISEKDACPEVVTLLLDTLLKSLDYFVECLKPESTPPAPAILSSEIVNQIAEAVLQAQKAQNEEQPAGWKRFLPRKWLLGV
jgi:hypothetical protein